MSDAEQNREDLIVVCAVCAGELDRPADGHRRSANRKQRTKLNQCPQPPVEEPSRMTMRLAARVRQRPAEEPLVVFDQPAKQSLRLAARRRRLGHGVL
jgi:hypothetical protein